MLNAITPTARIILEVNSPCLRSFTKDEKPGILPTSLRVGKRRTPKHATNMRASGSDEALRLTPPRTLSLEQCIEFIADDELLEVTPENLRIRKSILKSDLRAKAKNSAK